MLYVRTGYPRLLIAMLAVVAARQHYEVGLTTLLLHGNPQDRSGLQHSLRPARQSSPTEALLRLQRSNSSVLDFLSKQNGEHLHMVLWRSAFKDLSDLIGEANGHQLS